jgi:septum formation protein
MRFPFRKRADRRLGKRAHVRAPTREIILASQSEARKRLLGRLLRVYQIDFRCLPAHLDEDLIIGRMINEAATPSEIAKALAKAKAEKIASQINAENLQAVVIGCDQLLVFSGQIFGKPGSLRAAEAQLKKFSGRSVDLLTAVCVKQGGSRRSFVSRTRIHFRDLSAAEIKAYVALDRPQECAGSFKYEAHGISLIASLKTTDPTGIEGLPIFKLSSILRDLGVF